jgi:hypothetical protein
MRGNITWCQVKQAGRRVARRCLPKPDPELIGRDEAIFLLHTAAEIEHSLMVQYLYTAMTLDLGTEAKPDPDTPEWQRIILGVAKEEMGHFITVLNLLRLIGGPLNFEREDTPFRSEYYPFHFSLRPLKIKAPVANNWDMAGSLNRYIAAEMPSLDQIKVRDRRDVAEALGCRDVPSLRARLKKLEVNQVGLLYERLIEIFSDKRKLRDEDFLAAEDIEGYLADARTWDRAGQDFNVLVPPTTTRREAIDALKEIAEQGEGQDLSAGASHFEKFLQIYRRLRDRRKAEPGWNPALPVPHDPTCLEIPKNPLQRAIQDAVCQRNGWTRITHPASRLWAQLFDLRYRMTLGLIMHQMLLDAKRGPDSEMARRALANAAITEMHSLGWLARAIVKRPLTNRRDGMRAAPSFELPYTFAFPDREADRARMHLAVLGAAEMLMQKLVDVDEEISKAHRITDEEKELLHWLALRDRTLRQLCDEIANKKVKWCKCPEEEDEEETEEATA